MHLIDIANERVVSFAEATSHLPRRRKGRKPHVATIYRWGQRGCRGVVLETIQVGGTRCTSVEALQRFFDRLSGGSAAAVAPATSMARTRQQLEVDRKLDAMGL
jgi:hypothetical protein